MKRFLKYIAILIFISGGILTFYMLNQKDTMYKEINGGEISNIISQNKDIYVELYSDTCVSCRKLKKDMTEVKKDCKERMKFTIYAINLNGEADGGEHILKEYNLQGVPAILKFNNGELINILNKNINKDDIRSFFDLK
ncbi:MAG: thioredoxin family protein [Clostridium sp.]